MNKLYFLQAMNSLGCFKDKEKLKRELLKAEHNTGLFLRHLSSFFFEKSRFDPCCVY